MTHAEIAANARKPYVDAIRKIAPALDQIAEHNAVNDDYREGWHAALAAVKIALKKINVL